MEVEYIMLKTSLDSLNAKCEAIRYVLKHRCNVRYKFNSKLMEVKLDDVNKIINEL